MARNVTVEDALLAADAVSDDSISYSETFEKLGNTELFAARAVKALRNAIAKIEESAGVVHKPRGRRPKAEPVQTNGAASHTTSATV